jgi:hypothetical protein
MLVVAERENLSGFSEQQAVAPAGCNRGDAISRAGCWRAPQVANAVRVATWWSQIPKDEDLSVIGEKERVRTPACHASYAAIRK